MLAAYWCWLCGYMVPGNGFPDQHYETGETIRFCTSSHRAEYQWLKRL